MHSDLKSLKKKLRAHVTDLRNVAMREIPDAALRIRDFFLSHYKNVNTQLIVAGTCPINGEVNPVPLMEVLEKNGHRLCLPITLERATPLVFRAYRMGDKLIPNVWDIGVPHESQLVVVPDILLCPMLAFDRRGGRLGYGGGYYDVTLQNLRAVKPILAVGLAYSAQEVAQVPLGAFDQKMDAIITENEVIIPI